MSIKMSARTVKGEPKTRNINIRVTEKEYEAINNDRSRKGLTITEWFDDWVFGNRNKEKLKK
jgi:predicted DNA binding CopG/RHH family protein